MKVSRGHLSRTVPGRAEGVRVGARAVASTQCIAPDTAQARPPGILAPPPGDGEASASAEENPEASGGQAPVPRSRRSCWAARPHV